MGQHKRLSFIMAAAACLIAVSAKAEPVETPSSPPAPSERATPDGTASAPQSAPAQAATIVYKQTTAEGRTVYGDTAMQGRPVEKIIRVPKATTGTWSAQQDMGKPNPSEAQKQSARSVTPSQAAQERRSEMDRTTQLVMDAEAALQRAAQAADAGKDPLPSERQRNANGSTRLSDAYIKRQFELQAEVDRASRALFDAFEAKRRSF